MKFKIIILFLCLIATFECCFYSEEYGVLSPDEAYVEVGHELSFNCSLIPKYVDDGVIDVSKVFFAKDEEEIDKKYVRKLDPYTLQLRIPNASLADLGTYSCKFTSNDKTKAICYSDALVGFKPLKVINFKCVYYYREKLLCSWTVPNNAIYTNYSLFHFFEGYEDEKKPCGNFTEDETNQYCYWDHNTSNVIPLHSDKYYLILYGKNILGKNEQPFEFNLTSIVRLPPPRKFQFVKGKLHWTAPENIRLDEKLKNFVHYRIFVIDKNNQTIETIDYHDDDKKKWNFSIDESYEIKNLKPFTTYRFNITCKADDPLNDNWSDIVSIEVITEANAPFTSPRILNQSFETALTLNSERHTTIYWEGIPEDEKNGPNFEYLVFYSEQSKENWIDNIVTYPNITLVLKSGIAYVFKIYSKNSVGLSSNYSIFILPPHSRILWNNDSDVLANMIKVFKISSKRYEITWKSLDSSNYTIFWCYSINRKCINQIHWQSIEKKNKYFFTPPDDQSNYIYRFGIAYNNYRNQTTGIIWAKCIINMLTKKIDGIYFWFSNTSSNSVVVNWKLSCESQRELIDKFHIQYCSKPFHCKVVYANREMKQYLINGLEPNSEYNITVTSPLLLYKNEPIKLKTDFGIPPPPREFSIALINESDFLIKWKSPKLASMIVQYKLELSGPSLSSKFVLNNQSCNEQLCNYTINGLNVLKPFTEYSFFLEACYEKIRCSEKVQQVFRTKPSYPGKMSPPIMSPIDSNTLRIYLRPPAKPNGPIDYYHVKIYEDTNFLLENSYPGHWTHVDENFDTCKPLRNNKKYFISVKASNIYDNLELPGNYSDKIPIPMYCPFQTVLSFNLILIFGIFIFLIIFSFISLYSYRTFKSIKQKNDNFTLNIAMEDQTFKDQFNNKSNGECIDTNNASESSLIESDSANANTNNSSNTINETTIFSSEEIQHSTEENNPRNPKNYIKLSTQFYSSDSGVSDMNHHDNLEYFWNQDDSKEPFLKNTTPIQLVNENLLSKLSTSAPSSSLSSPEHQRSPMKNIKSNNAKQAYVLIPSSNNSKYLPHSHTTHLPDSYNVNQV